MRNQDHNEIHHKLLVPPNYKAEKIKHKMMISCNENRKKNMKRKHS